MRVRVLVAAAITAAVAFVSGQNPPEDIGSIDNIVVIFAENRSFDALYGSFPGANGLEQAQPGSFIQVGRDGGVLKELPPIWRGLTAPGITPP